MTTRPETTPASDPDSPVDADVVVVGGGAAGLSASIFLARYGLETLVLARGQSAIRQCAHIENYLGFPGGISPERFLELGRRQAEGEGVAVREDMVESVTREDHFQVETQDDETYRSQYVLAASAYDGDYLAAFADDLDRTGEHDFLDTEGGRTPVDGLYATGWLTADTVHQVVVNAGDGARAAISLVRDDLSERYWPAIGEIYVDWVVEDGRYDGDDWEEHIAEWFDREMLPAPEDTTEAEIEQARADLEAAFRARQIDENEQARRSDRGQWLLLDHVEDAVVADYYEHHVADAEVDLVAHAARDES